MTAVATLAPTCEARFGFAPGEWEPMPLWCSVRIGLTVWTDRAGQTHRACRHHVAGLRYRYPEAEQARVAEVITAATREFEAVVIEDHGGYVVTADVPCRLCEEGDIVPHNPSPRCESGSRPHCTCDRCF